MGRRGKGGRVKSQGGKIWEKERSMKNKSCVFGF